MRGPARNVVYMYMIIARHQQQPGETAQGAADAWRLTLRAHLTAEALALLGFHEGTKRVVACKAGVLKGLEVQFVTDSWSFGEPFIGNVRLLCSR